MTIRLWGNEKLVNTTTLNDQNASVVTMLQNGGYVIAWVDDMAAATSVVRFQRYDAAGAKVGLETTVPIADGLGDQLLPSLSALSNGGFIIGVQDNDGIGINDSIAVQFDSNGLFVRNTVLAIGTAFDLMLDQHANNTAAIYLSNDNIITQSVDNLGNNVLPAFSLPVPNLRETFPHAFAVEQEPIGFATGIVAVVSRLAGVDTIELHYLENTLIAPAGAAIEYSTSGSNVLSLDAIFLLGELGSKAIVAASLSNGTIRIYQGFSELADPILGSGGRLVPIKDGQFALTYRGNDGFIWLQMFDEQLERLGSKFRVSANEVDATSTFDIQNLSDGRLVITWTDVSNNSDGNGSAVNQQIIDPRDGLVNGTANAETLYGNDIYNDEIHGYAGNDTMHGLAGSDVIYGGNGNDNLNGGRGDDTLYGGNDNDTLTGGLGADEIYGDAGTDAVSFVASTAGVNVNLITGEGFGGEAEGDLYVGVESFAGTRFNDVVVTTNAASRMDGYRGDDTMTGGSGADVFYGGAGADIMNGGGGVDRAYYSASTAININLATNVNTGGEAQGDTLTNIEEISGSAFADVIVGNGLKNRLLGQNGNDRLDGGVGADTLTGGSGSDTFVFTLGQSGTAAATHDYIGDYQIGAVGVGDEIDASVNLSIGGVTTAATATQASIDATTGVATFASGSGTTLADALADITFSMNSGGNLAGEFAFFRISGNIGGIGDAYMFISDGVAGIGVNDVLVRMAAITSIGSISIDAGDVTILT